MSYKEVNLLNANNFFQNHLNKKLKKPIKIIEKESSKLMAFIGFFLSLFKINTRFMSSYITTINNTIYFPKELIASINPKRFMETIIHESIHAIDEQNNKIVYKPTYLPELFFGLPLLILSIFFFIFKLLILGSVFLFFALICISPIPKYGRYHWEMRAYSSSLFIAEMLGLEDWYLSQLKNWIKGQLSTSSYYFTMPIEKFYTDEKFENYINQIEIKEEIKKFFNEDFINL